jgi:hypothetical protein
MASRLVKQVKDLIAGNSASKKSGGKKDALAPLNTLTVSVREMLFGSPKKSALIAPLLDASTVAVSSGHPEDEKLPITVIPPTNAPSWKEVVIKQVPPDELDYPGDDEAYGDGMDFTKANSVEVINTDEFSFAS